MVTLRHRSRLHHIGIGRAHAGKRVTLLVADLHIRITTDDGELLRDLILDPFRPGREFGEAIITFRDGDRASDLILIADRDS